MSYSYKLTTDYDWILEQVENTLWILQKASPRFDFSRKDTQEIERVFDKIKEKIKEKDLFTQKEIEIDLRS
jgi:ACT domain-containing protein